MRGDEPFVALAETAAPVLIVAGSHDEYCPPALLNVLVQRLPRAHVRIVDGANHFFFGKLFPLGEALADWARALEPRQARRSGSAR
jgi:alpha/beta superfamily hydrolase